MMEEQQDMVSTAPAEHHVDHLRQMRHDLRTPVNHIIGYSEMFLEEAEELGLVSFQGELQRIRAAGKHLLTLLTSLLDLVIRNERPREVVLIQDEIRLLVNQTIGYSVLLQETARAESQESYIADLQKIEEAGGHLLTLLAHYLDEAAPPIAAAPAPPAAAAAEQAGDKPVVTGGHLLVVDDNEVNRDMLSKRLERQGYSVAMAANGREALEMVRDQNFDLVLLDIMMPELDGYDVLARLKADPESRHIPVIMISALDQIDSVVRCIEMGAEDYLPKPFDPVLLKARIGASLEQKRLRDAEVLYLQQVTRVTDAAAEVEAGTFDPETLADVATRSDQLGQLARVFQRMAREVQVREQRLKQELHALRIEIDESRQAKQVAEITETEYFQDLRRKAKELRGRSSRE